MYRRNYVSEKLCIGETMYRRNYVSIVDTLELAKLMRNYVSIAVYPRGGNIVSPKHPRGGSA
jgi:hypothetical protein